MTTNQNVPFGDSDLFCWGPYSTDSVSTYIIYNNCSLFGEIKTPQQIWNKEFIFKSGIKEWLESDFKVFTSDMLFLVSCMVKPAQRTSPLLQPSVGGWEARDTERRAITYESLVMEQGTDNCKSSRTAHHGQRHVSVLTHTRTASSWTLIRWSPDEPPLLVRPETENQVHCDALKEWTRGTRSHPRPPGEPARISWFSNIKMRVTNDAKEWGTESVS